MSKSKLYSRLTGLLSSTQNAIKPSTKPSTLPLTKPTIPTTLPKKTLDLKIKELLDEKDSQVLVEKFNYLSQFTNFRDSGRVVYKVTTHRLALSNEYPLLEKVLQSQEQFITNEDFACRIIHFYGKYGMFDHAYKVFDELPLRNVKQGVDCFSVLLTAAVSSEKYDEFFEMFREFPEKLSIKLNLNCYNTAMRVLCVLGSVEDAVSLLDEVEANGLKPDIVSFNTLMRVYYEAGECKKGDKLWERMIRRNVVPNTHSYTFKLQGLINNEKLPEALEYAMQLEDKGSKLQLGVYNVVIHGLIKHDDLVGVKEWYGKLIKSGCTPNNDTFDTLVPFLCQKGDYGLAFEVCEHKLKGRHCSIDGAALQNVVDGLAKNSMADKAKVLVQLGLSNSYAPCRLVLPESLISILLAVCLGIYDSCLIISQKLKLLP